MAARRTQAERKAESDSRIIQAAVELFAEKGYTRTTLGEVGSRAGYTGGLVSKRFGSKSQLLNAVLDDILANFASDVQEGLRDTTSILQGVELYAEFFLKRITQPESRVRALYALLGESLGAVPEIRAQFGEFNRQAVASLASYIQTGVDRGEIHAGLDPVRVATMTIGTLRGLTIQYIIDPRSLDVERIKRDVNAIVSTMAAGKTE